MNNRVLRVAVVTQYFYPETFLINDLVEEMVRQGHVVDVFTGKPNYPTGTVYPGFTERGCDESSFKGLATLHRAPLRARRAGGGRNLLLNYISFVWNGLRHFPRMMHGRKYDIVFVYAPSPITSVIPAILMKLKARAPLFLWVQDLWPESLEATGFVKNKLLLKIVGGMVRVLYTFVDRLLVQSTSFVDPVSRYARRDKISYYPNSYRANTDHTVNAQVPESLVTYLQTHFCIVFAGNLGTAQSLDTILAAAVRLVDLPAIKIVMVGAGSRLEWLSAEVTRLKLHNVLLAGAFPQSAMASVFAMSSGLLVTLKEDRIFSYTVPSKVQAYLAAGRPIVAALNGEGARIIREAGAGFASSAGDDEQLARSIKTLHAMPEQERQRMGRAGNAYFQEHFELEGQCRKLVQIFHQYLDKEQATA